MKKILSFFVMLVAVFAFTSVLAQPDQDQETVLFNADLLQVFNLNVTFGDIQNATFDDANEYNVGVDEGNGIVPGYSTVTMEATGNWNLQIMAPDFSGAGTIPIDNLGVWVEATGAHQFNNEVITSAGNVANTMGLGTSNQMLINLNPGNNNGGDASDNEFVLHWRMGTMDGTMEPTSMFDQMSLGLFGIGSYSTTVTLTMTEIP